MTGFIKVNRDTMQSGLLQNPTLLQVWMYLRCRAWFRQTEQDGITIQPGQMLITAREIATVCELSEHKVRYALGCLEEMGLISRKNIRNRYSLITMLESDANKPAQDTPEQTAATEETDHAPIETTANTSAKAENAPKSRCGVHGNVFLTAEEKHNLQQRCAVAELYIDNLSTYKQNKNKEYADDYSVLLEWICKDEIKNSQRPHPQYSRPAFSAETNFMRQTQQNYDFMSSPASYDLEWAEKQAREKVPVFRKRRT